MTLIDTLAWYLAVCGIGTTLLFVAICISRNLWGMAESWFALAFILLPVSVACMRAFGAWNEDIAIALAGCWGAMIIVLFVGGWHDRQAWRRRLSPTRS